MPIVGVQVEDERYQTFVDAKHLGGGRGALFLHKMLHPYYWGVSMEQFHQLMLRVKEGVARGSIVNFTLPHLPQYEQDRFDHVGPNVYQVYD